MGKITRNFYLYSNFLLVIALITMGTSFSKFHVIGPIYLHDFVLMLLAISAIANLPRRLPFIPIVILLLISLFYLVISLVLMRTLPELVIRQYAIFGYLGCSYLIFSKTLGTPFHSYKNFIFRVGVLSVLIQILYIVYLVSNGVSVLDEYHYYSPATVLGIIIFGASIFAFVKSAVLKFTLFAFTLLLSATTGHSSAALSLIFVLGVYLLFKVTNKSKLIIAGGGLFVLLALYLLLPQFRDNNAGFRLITWSYTIKRIFLENFGLIGEGFGIPYFDTTLISELYYKVGSEGFYAPGREYEGYVSSVHNSFLTIFLSVGFLPGLLIFLPFKRLLSYMNTTSELKTPDADFIFLSLVGISVWISFNEILELPHAACLFWLVYFCSLSIPSKDSIAKQKANRN